MADEFFSGLVRSDEDREWLADNARRYAAPSNAIEPPKELDPRPIIRVENQRSRNSCVGHGYSSNGEICAYIDSGCKERPQFSRWGCYIWAQTESGFAGRDQGAGVAGAVKAAVKYGFCPEELWPYPGDNQKYSTAVPPGALVAAAPFQLLQHTTIRSYDQAIEWIKQGRGGLILGVDWTTGLANNRGPITLADAKSKVVGGHCIFGWGYDADGLIYMGNSHSENWGDRGWRLIRPEVMDRWCQSDEVYGMSDLKSIEDSRPVIVDPGEGM